MLQLSEQAVMSSAMFQQLHSLPDASDTRFKLATRAPVDTLWSPCCRRSGVAPPL